MPRPRRRQAGVAIITVLLVVTLATLIVASLFWRETVTVRSVENRLALAQVRWIEAAVLDWAEVVLRIDQNSTGNVDHLGEVWALPVAETRLDETVTGGAQIADSDRNASLAGQVFDAQSRLNLNDLIIQGRPSQAHREAFERLLGLLGRPESLAAVLQLRLQRAYPPIVENVQLPATALPLLKVNDLRAVPGFDDDTVAALRPFVEFIPKTIRHARGVTTTENLRVNINTAPAEVLAAAIPGIDLQTARQFVEGVRQRTFFASLDVARSQFIGAPELPDELLSVGSNFFLVAGVVRFGRVEAQSEALLYRGAGRVERVWQHRY
ncbi:MAG: type II secretion system minor pseudopilin GspK [Limnobacter sp.]|nr:type II secretion system minor pseudopilin GspK [Limnobacter sp.]